jgi:hypothetical protein
VLYTTEAIFTRTKRRYASRRRTARRPARVPHLGDINLTWVGAACRRTDAPSVFPNIGRKYIARSTGDRQNRTKQHTCQAQRAIPATRIPNSATTRHLPIADNPSQTVVTPNTRCGNDTAVRRPHACRRSSSSNTPELECLDLEVLGARKHRTRKCLTEAAVAVQQVRVNPQRKVRRPADAD